MTITRLSPPFDFFVFGKGAVICAIVACAAADAARLGALMLEPPTAVAVAVGSEGLPGALLPLPPPLAVRCVLSPRWNSAPLRWSIDSWPIERPRFSAEAAAKALLLLICGGAAPTTAADRMLPAIK